MVSPKVSCKACKLLEKKINVDVEELHLSFLDHSAYSIDRNNLKHILFLMICKENCNVSFTPPPIHPFFAIVPNTKALGLSR